MYFVSEPTFGSCTRSFSSSLVLSVYCLLVSVSGHSSSPLSSKYSKRSCLSSFSQACISSYSSLSLVLACCKSLCLCLVSASNLSPWALVSLFLGIQEGRSLYCLFTKVRCIFLQKQERAFCPVYCVSTTRAVRLDARPVRSWIYIDVRILVLL